MYIFVDKWEVFMALITNAEKLPVSQEEPLTSKRTWQARGCLSGNLDPTCFGRRQVFYWAPFTLNLLVSLTIMTSQGAASRLKVASVVCFYMGAALVVRCDIFLSSSETTNALVDGVCKQGRFEQHTKPSLHIPCKICTILRHRLHGWPLISSSNVW